MRCSTFEEQEVNRTVKNMVLGEDNQEPRGTWLGSELSLGSELTVSEGGGTRHMKYHKEQCQKVERKLF